MPKQDSSQSEDSRNQSNESSGHSAALASEDSCRAEDNIDTQAQEDDFQVATCVLFVVLLLPCLSRHLQK